MNEEAYIKKYGKEAFEKKREQIREWDRTHPASSQQYSKKWRRTHPTQVQANDRDHNRKEGKYYERKIQYQMNGVPHARHLIRHQHGQLWRRFKQIIAPESQIHHEWIPGTADYTGVALVEKDAHMLGFVDVIQILEGEITLLTEAEVRTGGMVE